MVLGLSFRGISTVEPCTADGANQQLKRPLGILSLHGSR